MVTVYFGKYLTCCPWNAAGTTRRRTGDLGTEDAVAEIYSTEEFALIGKGLNTCRSGRTLNTARTLVRAAAGDTGTRDIVALIDAAMALAISFRSNDTIAVGQTAGTANDAAITQRGCAGNAVTLINTADFLTF
jgi:hypothetical protein